MKIFCETACINNLVLTKWNTNLWPLYLNNDQNSSINWIIRLLLSLLCWPKVILLSDGYSKFIFYANLLFSASLSKLVENKHCPFLENCSCPIFCDFYLWNNISIFLSFKLSFSLSHTHVIHTPNHPYKHSHTHTNTHTFTIRFQRDRWKFSTCNRRLADDELTNVTHSNCVTSKMFEVELQ